MEEVPIEFRNAVQENIEAEQPPTCNQPLQAEKDEEVDEQFVAVQEMNQKKQEDRHKTAGSLTNLDTTFMILNAADFSRGRE